jgi:hypothetical protein
MNETRWPIPPGTPEAKAAIERVKELLAAEDRRKPVVTPASHQQKRRDRTGRICSCGRRVMTVGETKCWQCRQRGL